jgi:hypothetical protein
MWVTGMFTWIDTVQSNSIYSENLERVVEGDMSEEEFIDAVSEIVGSNDDGRMKRRSNFQLAIDAVGVRDMIGFPLIVD